MERRILLGALLVLVLFTPALVSKGQEVKVRNLITDKRIHFHLTHPPVHETWLNHAYLTDSNQET